MHTQPVTSVDQRRSSLGLSHKIAKIVWLGVVEQLHAPFGHDTAAVRLEAVAGISAVRAAGKSSRLVHTPITKSASRSALVGLIPAMAWGCDSRKISRQMLRRTILWKTTQYARSS